MYRQRRLKSNYCRGLQLNISVFRDRGTHTRGFVGIADLDPYLGQHDLGDGVNIFGEKVDVNPRSGNLDLNVEYPGAQSIGICQQILKNFGTVTDNGNDTFAINPGDTISGYIGGSYTETGCSKQTGSDVYYIAIIVD